jgi:hypothetical protein
MAAYSFVTHWRLNEPLDVVWMALRYAQGLCQAAAIDRHYHDLTPQLKGVGTQAERAVQDRLPYTLRYITTTTDYKPPCEVAYDATGELNGRGRFLLSQDAGQTAKGERGLAAWLASHRTPVNQPIKDHAQSRAHRANRADDQVFAGCRTFQKKEGN